MKTITRILVFLLLCLFWVGFFCLPLNAQTVYKNVQKSTDSNNRITENLNFGSGKTLRMEAGSTLNATGATIIGISGGGGGGSVAISGTPSAGQSAEWTDASTIQGVAVTGTGSYVKATAPALALDGTFTASITTNSGTTYTVVLTDNIVTLNNASPVTVTLPSLASISTHSKAVEFKNLGAGLVTIQRAGSDTIFTFSSVTSFSLMKGEACRLNSTATQWIVF